MQTPYDDNSVPSYNDPIPQIPEGVSSREMAAVAVVPGGSPSGPPTVRFELIGEAWTLFQAQMAAWVLATLIYCTIIFLPILITLGLLYYRLFTTDPNTLNSNPWILLGPLVGFYAVLLFWVAPLGILLSGGLYRMAIRQMRGEDIAVADIFKVGDVFGSLLGSTFLIGLVVTAAAILGLILCGLPALVATALLMLTIPLIVDRRIGATEAMRLSWNALKPHWLMATLFYFVISFVGNSGFLICSFGIVFTFPIFILANALLYRDFFDRRESSPMMSVAPHEPPTGFGYTPQ